MLKKRLIPVLFIKNGHIVRCESFSEHKIIGNVVNEVRRYNEWDIDELIYIDISKKNDYDSGRNDHNVQRVKSIDQIIHLAAKECFMPLTFGGGIRSLAKIESFIKNGADKVIINTLLFESPAIVRQAVDKFGSQAIVACLDYRVGDGDIHFYSHGGTKRQLFNLSEIVKLITGIGCGELFINSIDNDGIAEGYDIKSTQAIAECFSIPVIACGGAGSTYDFEELSAIDSVSAIAAGNLFHFTENAYPRAKKELKARGYNFR
jgi:imidazole glycerol-phosphate synthase subunit HisF